MDWIKIEAGCQMPKYMEEVLVTVEEDASYGKGTEILRHVDWGTYDEFFGYVESANGVGGFITLNDWREGQPCKIVAWMKLPEPFQEI